MIKQTLFITTPAQLSLDKKQLIIQWKGLDGQISRPIEDIGVVIVESQMAKLTVPLLNALADNNALVVFCNNKCMPNCMLTTFQASATQSEGLKYQLLATEPCKKQIWKQIIEVKIKNQSMLLEKYSKQAALLKPLYMHVKSGDTDNREGTAARIYWHQLFGPDFLRGREGEPPNNLLNYGYSILRAACARALLGSGLLPYFGVFHHNRYNSFPLADDIMEPYRPFVDDVVYQMHLKGCKDLDKQAKANLINVLYCDTLWDGCKKPLQVALSATTASLLKVYRSEINKLSLPMFSYE